MFFGHTPTVEPNFVLSALANDAVVWGLYVLDVAIGVQDFNLEHGLKKIRNVKN